MNDLAGFVVIGAFFVVAFGSMMLCGVAGGLIASIIPAIRLRATPTRQWVLLALLAGDVGGFAAVLAWGALRSVAPSSASNAMLPLMCWATATLAGAGSRTIGGGD